MFFSKTWDEVPAGSTLQVTFKASAAFVMAGEHVVDRGPSAPVLVGRLPSDLTTLSIKVNEDENHIVKIDVGFAGQTCAVEVDAKITAPGGGAHQQAFTGKHSLKNPGDMLTVKLAAVGEA